MNDRAKDGIAARGGSLATSLAPWGIDSADGPDLAPWQKVLDEVGQSGVFALELGPIGYLPEDGPSVRAALSARGLSAVGSHVYENLHDPSRRRQVVAAADRAARLTAEAEGQLIVVIDKAGAERDATAGFSDRASRLGDAGWRTLADGVAAIVEIAAKYSVRVVLHQHAGTYVEFADEVNRLLDSVDVSLCLDTGHAVYAGIDPAEALNDWASRIGLVHLRDVSNETFTAMHAAEFPLSRAVLSGVFCPIGTGDIDCAALFATLQRIDYGGYVTIEQQPADGAGPPLDQLRRSVRAIRDAQTAAATRA